MQPEAGACKQTNFFFVSQRMHIAIFWMHFWLQWGFAIKGSDLSEYKVAYAIGVKQWLPAGISMAEQKPLTLSS